VFIPIEGDGRTLAEMTSDEKNTVFSRGRAARTDVLMRRLRARRRWIERDFTSAYVSLVSQCFEEVAENLSDSVTVFRLDASEMSPPDVLERFQMLEANQWR
jgi:hypothetical protein